MSSADEGFAVFLHLRPAGNMAAHMQTLDQHLLHDAHRTTETTNGEGINLDRLRIYANFSN